MQKKTLLDFQIATIGTGIPLHLKQALSKHENLIIHQMSKQATSLPPIKSKYATAHTQSTENAYTKPQPRPFSVEKEKETHALLNFQPGK